MKRLIYIISAIAALGAAVAACGDAEREYSRWVDIPAKGGGYGDTIRVLPGGTSLSHLSLLNISQATRQGENSYCGLCL